MGFAVQEDWREPSTLAGSGDASARGPHEPGRNRGTDPQRVSGTVSYRGERLVSAHGPAHALCPWWRIYAGISQRFPQKPGKPAGGLALGLPARQEGLGSRGFLDV